MATKKAFRNLAPPPLPLKIWKATFNVSPLKERTLYTYY
uniref:Uncharacterized protein n=1 Tax=Nelumbo nucifera TaxID=4432 RepID=A0A822YDZ9_NELNU|nr:TPA_asm: hypothetical protein HUJ06_009631 [Nelumbo nucifera]